MHLLGPVPVFLSFFSSYKSCSPLLWVLGQLFKASAGWGLCLSKGRAVLISSGSEHLAQPWSEPCACPAAFQKPCLFTICRPETEPFLLGLQPKYCLFSWCVVQYLQARAQLGCLCHRSADSIPSHFLSCYPSNMKLEENVYG